jgi:hypothetical protein
LTSVTDDFSRSFTYSYRPDGRLGSINEPLASVSATYDYDARGNLTRAVSASGRTENFVYDEATVTDTIAPSEWTIDARCRLTCENPQQVCATHVAAARAECRAEGTEQCIPACQASCPALAAAPEVAAACGTECTTSCNAGCQGQSYTQCNAALNAHLPDMTYGATMCEAQCNQQCSSFCSPNVGLPIDTLEESQKCKDCCLNGANCASGSCNAGRNCVEDCRYKFMYGDRIENTCQPENGLAPGCYGGGEAGGTPFGPAACRDGCKTGLDPLPWTVSMCRLGCPSVGFRSNQRAG